MGEREGRKERSGGNRTGTDRLPSEKFGVLHREDVEELAALVGGLGEWTQRLCALLEELNDRLMIQPPHGGRRPLSFYRRAEASRENAHAQADLWEGFPLDDAPEGVL